MRLLISRRLLQDHLGDRGYLHFPSHSKHLNEVLHQETPEPFRRRGSVASANALKILRIRFVGVFL